MATINTNGLATLLDIQKMLDPNGRPARMIESLTTQSPFLRRIPWKAANGQDGELVSSRNGLPGLTWRKYNQGILPTKGTSVQWTETCGMLDGTNKVDVALARRNGGAAWRASQDMAFVASYHRTLESSMFYESTKTAPERMMGLSPRFDALTGIDFASQVLSHDASPSGNDQASIWLVGFGQDKVYGIYPPDSTAGLEMKDLGERMVDDGSGTGAEFLAQQSYFSWKCGLVVADARYVVRICNIDTSALAGTGSTLIDKLIESTEQINSLEDCTPVIFMNRRIRTYLRKQVKDTVRTGGGLTYETVGGKPQLYFDGIPIERTDALLNTEAPIT